MRWLGELYLNSIERGGTGHGYDLGTLNQLPPDCSVPVILAAGVGNATPLAAGLKDPRVNAVAIANLFNFVGDGLKRARELIVQDGEKLAV